MEHTDDAYPQPLSEMKTRCGLQKNSGKEGGKISLETEEELAGPPGFYLGSPQSATGSTEGMTTC